VPLGEIGLGALATLVPVPGRQTTALAAPPVRATP
jgi:hypothetical protein